MVRSRGKRGERLWTSPPGVPKAALEAYSLGLIFDQRLDFKAHTRHVTKRAARLATFLARVCRCYSGIPPDKAVQAVRTCVLPTLLYGSKRHLGGIVYVGILRPPLDVFCA